MGTARYPMACASSRANENCGLGRSAPVNGTTSTHLKPWLTRNSSSVSQPVASYSRGAALMSKSLVVRFASALLGIALLVCLVWRTGPANLLENVRTLGWGSH